MTPAHFKAIYAELVDENPFAIRAVLKVLQVEFTDQVPTLAVTVEARPRMRVNLGFIAAHCTTEAEVKAVICHEFLHILLRHTERFDQLDAAEHLALDAVINAIIHRKLGRDYSAMMSRYYAGVAGVRRLLRPPRGQEDQLGYASVPRRERQTRLAWRGLYAGTLVADDVAELARELRVGRFTPASGKLLGSHTGNGGSLDGAQPLPETLRTALDYSLTCLNGNAIWREPATRGAGTSAHGITLAPANLALARWRRETFAVLRKHVLPDPNAARHGEEAFSYMLPVLSPSDRRAALRTLWSPLLPDATWHSKRPGQPASAQVYLDASGSMDNELPLIVALLARLSGHIRQPFWAFSTRVFPARIQGGRLVTSSTGGTSLACVLKHIELTRPAAAVIVTDGGIEQVQKQDLDTLRGTRLHAVVTSGGSTQQLQEAGIACTRLSAVPA